jgi:hypothetical protein
MFAAEPEANQKDDQNERNAGFEAARRSID